MVTSEIKRVLIDFFNLYKTGFNKKSVSDLVAFFDIPLVINYQNVPTLYQNEQQLKDNLHYLLQAYELIGFSHCWYIIKSTYCLSNKDILTTVLWKLFDYKDNIIQQFICHYNVRILGNITKISMIINLEEKIQPA